MTGKTTTVLRGYLDTITGYLGFAPWKMVGKEDKLLILPATAITLKKMKSGGCHRFSLNKQLKLPYELCFSPKTNQPKKVQKIRYAKLNQGTSSGAVLFHSYTLFYPGICIYFLINKKTSCQ